MRSAASCYKKPPWLFIKTFTDQILVVLSSPSAASTPLFPQEERNNCFKTLIIESIFFCKLFLRYWSFAQEELGRNHLIFPSSHPEPGEIFSSLKHGFIQIAFNSLVLGKWSKIIHCGMRGRYSTSESYLASKKGKKKPLHQLATTINSNVNWYNAALPAPPATNISWRLIRCEHFFSFLKEILCYKWRNFPGNTTKTPSLVLTSRVPLQSLQKGEVLPC